MPSKLLLCLCGAHIANSHLPIITSADAGANKCQLTNVVLLYKRPTSEPPYQLVVHASVDAGPVLALLHSFDLWRHDASSDFTLAMIQVSIGVGSATAVLAMVTRRQTCRRKPHIQMLEAPVL